MHTLHTLYTLIYNFDSNIMYISECIFMSFILDFVKFNISELLLTYCMYVSKWLMLIQGKVFRADLKNNNSNIMFNLCILVSFLGCFNKWANIHNLYEKL